MSEIKYEIIKKVGAIHIRIRLDQGTEPDQLE